MKKKVLLVLLVGFVLVSCDETIFEEDISEESITIFAPTNGSSIATGAVSFNWGVLRDSTSYQIQVATPNFAEAAQLLVDTTTYETSHKVELDINEYQWRVRAVNSAYETLYTTASFTIE